MIAMLNLLKSDLYRISRPCGLRGSLWQYGLALALVYILIFLTLFVLGLPSIQDNFATPTNLLKDFTTFASPTQALASLTGGIVPLCATFMTVELALSDFKQGFIRTLTSARRGRQSYFAEKVLAAGAISLVLIAITSVVVLALVTLAGGAYAHADTPASVAIWALGFWLNTWALSALSLIFVYATRVNPVSYIGAWCLCVSIVPQTFMGLAYSSGGLLRFLQPVAPLLETLAAWIPSTAISNLAEGGNGLLGASIDIWGATSSALTINPAAQTILTGVIWIALAALVVLAIARSRDV